ncbi:unnamed protein product [Echinostoma caproni]|uniref:Late endosomal/lysosomal adaptor and MAPK and MTOR activator 1 n=1 Tax=Echinostoma caproni TaxID=27848 RepID=A0A183A1G5_9TREM|nr:unnamed protein product [Echinostoma caproni]
MDTIDSVLAQYTPSPSATNETASTEACCSPTSDPALDTNAPTSTNYISSIQQMVEHAKRRVEQSQHSDLDASFAQDAESIEQQDKKGQVESGKSIVTENSLGTVDLDPVSMVKADMVHVKPISENAKIDILLTGRKLLGD